MKEQALSRWRKPLALTVAVVGCIILITPFVVAVRYFDWGVFLLVLAPAVVAILMMLGRRLERWAVPRPEQPDPDYPDDPV
jgi:drug/metabolite transporter (DMT)-like permease